MNRFTPSPNPTPSPNITSPTNIIAPSTNLITPSPNLIIPSMNHRITAPARQLPHDIKPLCAHVEDITLSVVEEFLTGTIFRNTLVPKLKAMMMSPRVGVYLTKVRDWLMVSFCFSPNSPDDMSAHRHAWGIPDGIFDNPVSHKCFKARTQGILTDWRTQAKTKASSSEMSLSQQWPIWKLVDTVSHNGYVVNEAHYKRFACLQQAATHHAGLPQAKTKELKDFWKMVDLFLVEIQMLAEPQDSTCSKVFVEAYVNCIYMSDGEQFPGGAKSHKTVTSKAKVLKWQSDMEKYLQAFNTAYNNNTISANSENEEQSLLDDTNKEVF
ncbi:hypothetical protein K439DRAFT_1618942 [Ramaria rubella]|nr:hypothetical protein K439DRAFT_1618942 [Ramaria rubella]